ncbi:MAG: hypothetical protein WBQ25_19635 [Nitrososphaeraceae archaeon]
MKMEFCSLTGTTIGADDAIKLVYSKLREEGHQEQILLYNYIREKQKADVNGLAVKDEKKCPDLPSFIVGSR